MMKRFLILVFTLLSVSHFAQKNDVLNGDWKERYVLKQNTPEALYMIRYGDIDNLGYGWGKNFDPFTGKSTNAHEWPMQKTDETEINGFDHVMLGTGFTDPGNGKDGYSGALDYLKNTLGASTFDFEIPAEGIDTSKVKSATIQVFVDDFQPRPLGSKFEFYINGKRAPFVEKNLNALDQTGPIGKLLTLPVPKEFINEFKKDKIVFRIDDKTTGIGDGYAIDFFKILLNPITIKTGEVKGTVWNAVGQPMIKAKVSCGTVSAVTDAKGAFTLKGVPAGLALITVVGADKSEKDFTVDVEEGISNPAELRFEQN